ncbi:MAG: HAMP domain-containing protein, partial [Balneolaceae bacterium]
MQYTDFTGTLVNSLLPDLQAANLVPTLAILNYTIHAIIFLAIAAALVIYVKDKNSFTSNNHHYITFTLSALFGFLNVLLLLFYIENTITLTESVDFGLSELTLYPTAGAFLFYTLCGLFLSSLLILLISAGWLLFIHERDKYPIIAVISFISFCIGMFFAGLVLDQQIFFSRQFYLSVGLFLLMLISCYFIFKSPENVLEISGIRLILLASLVVSLTGYIIISDSSVKERDRDLYRVAMEFANEETTATRDITHQVLASIERRLLFLSNEDIDNRPGVVQSQFQRVVLASLQPDWRQYSFDIQFLKPDGTLISDYSTTLDSPAWTAYFDVDLMEVAYRGEQIRRETNRPVIREKPAGLSERFSSLHRGWIPIYDDIRPDEIIAWLFAAVYQERPDFNKPIRAVLAASTGDEWKNSYYIAEFENGISIRNTQKGFYKGQPEYNRLPKREEEIAMNDSIAYISNSTAQGLFREIVIKLNDEKIVKASTPVQGFNEHLFSFFRFNISLILLGILLFPVLHLLGMKGFALFKKNRRFQNRLLDGLLFAILIFLVALIFATRLTMTNQIERQLERDLITRLDNLTETMIRGQTDASIAYPSSNAILSTSMLNVDAIFYVSGTVKESTTPQIFQQHLIPRQMPYHVFDFLYNRQRRHVLASAEIGSEKLLVGYKALQNAQGEPVAALAIPTFLKSPVYTEQILETTSYLLVLYFIIFGFFITGAALFSRHLTKPIDKIRSGLDKISRGNLNIKLPVTSRDEIGSLSSAYN